MDENNVQNAVNEEAIPSEPEKQQEILDGNGPATEPQEQETPNGIAAQSLGVETTTQSEEPFLEIKYFKENVKLSREEAKNYAEIGKRFSDVREQLERVATLKGQTIDEFLNGLEIAQDEAYRQGLVEKFGDDEDTVNKMMELYNINKQKTLDAAKENKEAARKTAEQTENARLADEFIKMKSDFPELTEFAELPEQVRKAAFEGMSLSHAYLLYMHKEKQKIEAAEQAEKNASKASAGSLESVAQEDGIGDAFLRGLSGR